MGCLQDKVVMISMLVMGIAIGLVHAERTINVSTNACDSRIFIEIEQMLHLNYYGDAIHSEYNSCLFNFYSSLGDKAEICIQRKLGNDQDPTESGCLSSLKVYIGKFHSVSMPSRYSCADLRPLCTSEKHVNLLFTDTRFFNKTISIELDIYKREKTDRTITVGSSDCGGSINIDTVQMLHLNYYGDEIRHRNKFRPHSDSETCLYNVSSSTGNEWEICVQRKLEKHQNPWETSCLSSLKVYIGSFYSVHMPSRYSCPNLSPLCTSEKHVYLLFLYREYLRVLNEDISIELDVFLRKKTEMTTTPRLTTAKPSTEERSGLSVTWIIVIVVLSVIGVCFCSCCCYICCSKDKNEESQNVHDENNPEHYRMLPASVVLSPPGNTSGAPGDPPAYSVLFTPESTAGEEKNEKMQLYNPSGFEEEKLNPSAPPPPYHEI